MAINFPSTTGQPTDGSFTHVVGNITYRWNGVSWTASVFSGGSLDDLTNVDALTNIANGKILKYNSGSELWEVADDGGGGGVALTDFSVTVNSAGTAGLTYNSTTGVFSYTPPDLSSYLTSETQTLDNVLQLGASTTRDITTTGKILYSNVYNTSGDLPDANTYHGMFAHVHADAHGYFAHSGAWTQLLDTGSSLSELTDVSTTAPNANDVLTWDGSNWGPSAAQGSGGASGLSVSIPHGATDVSKTFVAADANSISGTVTDRLRVYVLPEGSTLNVGDQFYIFDIGDENISGNAATYNISIGPHFGDRIQGAAANTPYIIASNMGSVRLIWMGPTYQWRVFQ